MCQNSDNLAYDVTVFFTNFSYYNQYIFRAQDV